MSNRLTIWDIISPLKIRARKKCDVLVVKNKLNEADDLGLYEPANKRILIKNVKSHRQKHWTGFHELLHALSDYWDINLTESQVQKLEKAFETLYRLNDGFTVDPP